MGTRWEHDFIGDMELDDQNYYGIQTMRGMGASPHSGQTMNVEETELIYYLAVIKKAAALANGEIGAIDSGIARAIAQACDEVIAGKYEEQFPVDLFTGGGGITPHMNINEVLANRASEILSGKKDYHVVHPNTHVNKCQSTNDVYPSALLLAMHKKLEKLEERTRTLCVVLKRKAEEFKSVVKIGRTCYQDALPVTLGQEFGGYASFVSRQARFIKYVSEECLEIPLGGTAVGTGVGCEQGYTDAVLRRLREITGWDIRLSANYFDSFQNGDLYTRISYALKALSSGVSKMSSDMRIMSSGPRAGFSEISLPEMLPGSSIMPGKINPTIPELMNQVCYQICGNDMTISMAVERSDLDLNVWEGIIAKCLFESATILTNSLKLFTENCVSGIRANAEQCREYAENSVSLSAVVSSLFGYPTGAKTARLAVEKNKKISEIVVEEELLTQEQAEELLNPLNLTDRKIMEDLIKKFRTP